MPQKFRDVEHSRIRRDARIKALFPFQPKTVAIVERINAGVNPPLFYLRNLVGIKIKWTYYQENLLKIEEEKINSYLEVNKILKKRKTPSGGDEFLVNFLFQPSTYTKWLTKDQFVKKK